MSTSVTETLMKSAVKIQARKTNNQASFCCSILRNNMKMEAAMEPELVLHLDETGLLIVYTAYTLICKSLHIYTKKRSLGTTTPLWAASASCPPA
jgi:hypothetical protein